MISGKAAGKRIAKGKKKKQSQQLLDVDVLDVSMDNFLVWPSPCSVHKQTFPELADNPDAHIASGNAQKFKLLTVMLYTYWG